MAIFASAAGDEALALFDRERANFRTLVGFLYSRDSESTERSVKIILSGREGTSRMTLTFERVSQVRMKANDGHWDLRIRSMAEHGWESIAYQVWEGEGN